MVLLVGSTGRVAAQFYSMRTNGLLLLTGTANLGFGVSVAKKWSLDFTAAYNPIDTKDIQLNMYMLQQGFRKWSFESNIGFFWGMHLTEALYKVGNRNLHYQGFAAGLGASVGYSLYLSRRWNLSFELGGSALYMQDMRTQHSVPDNEDQYTHHHTRWALAPTKAEVSIVYLF